MTIIILSLSFIGQVIINKYKVRINRINRKFENSEIQRNHLDLLIRDQFALNGKKIEDWVLIRTNGESVKISDLKSKRDCFFFIFSEYSCFDCINKSLVSVRKNLKKSDRLIIICGFDNIHKVQNWASQNDFSGEIFFLEDFSNCVFSKYYNYPYLFRVNDDLQILNAVSLSKTDNYISLYFDTI